MERNLACETPRKRGVFITKKISSAEKTVTLTGYMAEGRITNDQKLTINGSTEKFTILSMKENGNEIKQKKFPEQNEIEIVLDVSLKQLQNLRLVL